MKVAHQDSSKVGEKEEQRARTPSPKSANGGSTTDDSDGDLVSSKADVDPQKKGFAVINNVRGGRGHSRHNSATKTKLCTGHSNGHESPKDENSFLRILAENTKRHEESLSASPDAVNEAPDGTHSAPKAKAKLGKIGGKKKLQDERSQPLNQPVEGMKIPHLKSPGHAGTGADIESSTSRDSLVTKLTRTRRTTTKAESPSARETSQERANRKRAELKRNLEDKSKGTAKKKRKF